MARLEAGVPKEYILVLAQSVVPKTILWPAHFPNQWMPGTLCKVARIRNGSLDPFFASMKTDCGVLPLPYI